ncbi:MAG: histidine kinase dimerization/phosphoacceptor domain -containing protein [Vicingaceae bacterium]
MQIRNKAFSSFISLFLVCVLTTQAQDYTSKSQSEKLQAFLDKIAKANDFISSDSALARQTINGVDLVNTSLADSNYRKLVNSKIEFYETHFDVLEITDELTAAIEGQDEDRKAFLHDQLAQLYFNAFEFEKALNHLQYLIDFYANADSSEKHGELLLRKSALLNAQGQYIESIETTFEAVDQFKNSNESKHLAFSYLQIGSTYLFIEFYNEAEEYYKLAGEQFLGFGDTLGYAICESNIALVEYERENYKTAIQLLKKNLPSIIKSNRKTISSFAFQALSDCYFKLVNHDSALYFINKSFEVDKEMEYTAGLTKDYSMLAELAYLSGDNKKALNFGKKAIDHLQLAEDFQLHSQVALLMANLHEQSGNPIESNRFLRKYIALNDSLKIENEVIERIAHQENSKLKATEFELELAIEKEKLQKRENKNQQYIIWSLIALILIKAILFFLIWKANRKNKRLNEELFHKKQELEEELKIKRSLLQEIHHRVKNNLQVISSMLSIQAQYLKNEKLEKIIDECRGRINSMSLIHESLYKSEKRRNPLFNEYIKELIPQLIDTYQVDQSKIKLKFEVEKIELNLDESMPCGLIINEVVSNAIKHAFPGERNGEIHIEMKEVEGCVKLKIADNGIGISPDFKPQEQNTFGYLLIYTLAAQLEAEVNIETTNGLSYEFFWKKGI